METERNTVEMAQTTKQRNTRTNGSKFELVPRERSGRQLKRYLAAQITREYRHAWRARQRALRREYEQIWRAKLT